MYGARFLKVNVVSKGCIIHVSCSKIYILKRGSSELMKLILFFNSWSIMFIGFV
jgi:hypothetical protein